MYVQGQTTKETFIIFEESSALVNEFQERLYERW